MNSILTYTNPVMIVRAEAMYCWGCVNTLYFFGIHVGPGMQLVKSKRDG